MPESIGPNESLFPQSHDEIKPVSKLEMAKAIVLSPTAIKRTFRALAYQFMGISTSFSPEMSAHFKALSAHETNKVFAQFAKSYFGRPMIGEARNIARREVLNSHEDFEEGKKLLNQLNSKDQSKLMVEPISQVPESEIPDGICAGIRLDIAYRHLIKGEPIRDIVASNAKGARAEAAANQALYSLLDIKSGSPGLIFSRLFEKLNDIGRSNLGNSGPNPLKAGTGEARTDFTAVLRAFIKHDRHLKSDPDISKALLNSSGSEFESMVDDYRKYDNLHDFQKTMEAKIHSAYNDKLRDNPQEALKFRTDSLKQLRWLISFIEVDKAIRKPAPVVEEPKGLLSELLSLLKSILPSKEIEKDYIDNVSDLQHQHILKSLYRDMKEDLVYGAVAELRELKLQNLGSVIGSSSLFASDNTFLKGFMNLWDHPDAGDGVYAIDVETGASAHAITLVIEGQSGYILDPNGIQLDFDTPEQAQHLMRKLLSVYEPPSDKMQLDEKDVVDHRIAIRKFLKA